MATLDENGLDIATYEEIRASINSAQQATFGASIDVSDGSVMGQHIAIISNVIAELEEALESVYNSIDPDTATGARLDSLCALTGTIRQAATESTVTLTLTGTNATVVSTGSQVAVDTTGEIFITLADATLASLTAWASSTAYTVGTRRSNSGRSYICTVAGTSAGSGGPTTTASAIVDGTVTWRYLGEGAAAVDVAAESENTGPIAASAYDITTIQTPVSGWSSVINLLDATLGTNEETDEDLRIRREDELATPGTSTLDAIRSDLLDVDGVTAVTVFNNDTDVTDGDGVPPHAVEIMIQGGTDQDLWDQILASIPAGIATYGDETGTATDAAGNDHTINFSRPDELNIYVDVVLTKDPDEYPSDGDDQVKDAIVAWGDSLRVGRDVVASAISAIVFNIDGVLDVTDIDIGTSPSPTLGTTITVTTRQLALFDTSRITVTSSDGTP